MPLVHRWGECGRPPGIRTLPFPVICLVSQAYKAHPLPRAADKIGAFGGIRTHSTDDLNVVRMPDLPFRTDG